MHVDFLHVDFFRNENRFSIKLNLVKRDKSNK